MKVLLVYAHAPRQVLELAMEVAPGTTLESALAQSGWPVQHPELLTDAVTPGIWGRKASRSAVLREGDRVEMYRALRVDPKVARRERFSGQGARAAGLFAQRRPGSKAGY